MIVEDCNATAFSTRMHKQHHSSARLLYIINFLHKPLQVVSIHYTGLLEWNIGLWHSFLVVHIYRGGVFTLKWLYIISVLRSYATMKRYNHMHSIHWVVLSNLLNSVHCTYTEMIDYTTLLWFNYYYIFFIDVWVDNNNQESWTFNNKFLSTISQLCNSCSTNFILVYVLVDLFVVNFKSV